MLVEEQNRVDHALEDVGSLRGVEKRRQREMGELLARFLGEQTQHRLHADRIDLHGTQSEHNAHRRGVSSPGARGESKNREVGSVRIPASSLLP